MIKRLWPNLTSPSVDTSVNAEPRPPSRLTLFAFLWACQALVHQDFYSRWLHENNPFGWVLTALAVTTLLRPSSLWLFAGMLTSSIIYNVLKWPFVVNHILLESIVNATILAAILRTLLFAGAGPVRFGREAREQVYDRFAPVVAVMVVLMYYFAFMAKLNWDFVNPDVTCVVVMNDVLLRRFPFLPDSDGVKWTVIVLTLVVEAAIPILLTFRRTRYLAVLTGVPFHIILGLVGHRTFSAFAFALYGLFCMNELVQLATTVKRQVITRLSRSGCRMLYAAGSAICIMGIRFLIDADLAGNYRASIGPLKIYQISWVIWILWSLIVGAVYAVCAWMYYKSANARSTALAIARPGLLWLSVSVVVLNGMSQYLGLKTETCFTMYSNLRTEGAFNNHFFMPAWRLASYQDDLVEIISTDLPELQEYIGHEVLMTGFELRRILSTTRENFELVYRRDGQHLELRKSGDKIPDSPLLQPHPMWLSKLLRFRPIPTARCAACQH